MQRCRCKETAFRSAKCNCRSKKGNARTVSGIQRAPTRIARLRQILPQGDELPTSSQIVCGGAAELSRSAVAAGRIRNLLSLRAERRVDRTDAGALDADERRASLYDAGAVRSGVQRRERDVSKIFQALRDREISDAVLDPRSIQTRSKICR